MSEEPRYIIGIDLGTTNSCVAYVDTHQNLTIHPFRIPQLNAAGYMESLATLPSCCYLAPSYESVSGILNLPWAKERNFVVGSFAHAQGAKTATRLIQSAKSWLCNAAANRKDKILPIEANATDQRMSPIEVTSYYLRHICEAWNHSMAKDNPHDVCEQQEIILTIPASFDEVARTLTIEAAKMAGFSHVTLLEEPQAAFYSWIIQHEDRWQQELKENDSILVCDVGGGTTDFSLIEVVNSDQQLAFKRMAVGNHLLLGGDNMDFAIAHFLEKKLSFELSPAQWSQLRYHARCAKETIMNGDSNHYRVVLQGSGSSVVQGTIATEINKEEMSHLLLEGFFGQYPWHEATNVRKTSGIRTIGLPYEDEPSITKQLAHFLGKNPNKIPTHVLFNGGTMKPKAFQISILQSLQSWFPESSPKQLLSSSLDLAVSRGAAYFGKVRRGLGIRIGGGASRTYYLGIGISDEKNSVEQHALTILSRGVEEGHVFTPEQSFWLLPNQPIAFDLYASHTRIDDKEGQLIPIDQTSMQKLPPIHTVLRFGSKSQEKIGVQLSVKFTEIGTIELWLTSKQTDHKWSLEFQLRSSEGKENSLETLQKARIDETFDSAYLQEAEKIIYNVFQGDAKPGQLMEKLENLFQQPRRSWPLSILRGLWPSIIATSAQRKRTTEHEIRWWNITGFVLKPGIGYPLDDFRLKEIWKIILEDLKIPKSSDVELQQCICFRRIACGLNRGQQLQIAHPLFSALMHKKSGRVDFRGKNEEYHYVERIRTLAAMEMLDMPMKLKLGHLLLHRILTGQGLEGEYWALGRIGARQLICGSIAYVVPRDICLQWLEQLLSADKADPKQLVFVIGQLARKTGQREWDIPQAMIDKILAHIPENERLSTLLQQETLLTASEQEHVYGDLLPPGLTMRPA